MLNINLNKSKLSRTGGKGDGSEFARVLGCKPVNFPMKYLGVLLGAKCKVQIT